MAKYSLVGVDGNAFAIMGYTSRALKREGLGELVDKMHEEATASDYDNLLCVCDSYVEKANEKARENGYKDEEGGDE